MWYLLLKVFLSFLLGKYVCCMSIYFIPLFPLHFMMWWRKVVLILLIIGRYMFPEYVRILGGWRSTPCLEAKDTLDIIYILLIGATLYPLQLHQLREYSIWIPLLYFSSPSPSVSAADSNVFLSPACSITACSHHVIPTHPPWFLSLASHKSIIGCVAI